MCVYMFLCMYMYIYIYMGAQADTGGILVQQVNVWRLIAVSQYIWLKFHGHLKPTPVCNLKNKTNFDNKNFHIT